MSEAIKVRGPGKVLFGEEEISERVAWMGRELARDLEGDLAKDDEDAQSHPDRVVILPILTGAFVFTADLIRSMPLKMSIRLVTASSYPGEATTSRGARLRGVIPSDLGGRHVVIIDDILDTGNTLELVRGLILEQNPASLRIVVLLDKQVPRHSEITPNYVGFEIPDEFVVGYGLDWNGYYRNLREIVTLEVE